MFRLICSTLGIIAFLQIALFMIRVGTMIPMPVMAVLIGVVLGIWSVARKLERRKK